MNPLLIILVAVLIIVVMGVVIALVLNQESQKKQKLVSVIQGRAAGNAGLPSKEDVQNKRRAEIAKKLKDSKDEDAGAKKKKTIALMISQAGVGISTKHFWLLSVLSAGAFAFGAKFFGMPLFVVVMAAIVGFFGAPRFVLKHLAAKRQKQFLQEFPDALDATVRLLKAGMPISEAIAMISREFSGPVGEEMSVIYDKQKIGVPMHEAAMEATRRVPLPEMQMFATGLAIQAQTGSSLSEVLSNLSNVIRERFKLKRKVKALSSEAVASASIIGALPVMLSLGMYFTNREYIMVLVEDSFGNVLLAGAVIWMCIGIVVMKVMINFKI